MNCAGHKIETCCCGNVLKQCRCMSGDKTRIVWSPCHCDHPGDQARMLPTPGTLPSFMHDSAVKERRAAGLRDCTDYERGVAARWI